MGAIVQTQWGAIEGREESGLHVFRGIPYAKAPLGPGRFAAPEPPEPWTGVRDAGDFGASPLQNPMGLSLPGMDVGPSSEDCLYLNVWTPEVSSSGSARRPVLVWIHGGAFVLGSGSQSLYHGEELATRGDLVVVTVNYRLGALGFLHLAELCPDLPGAVSNAGLRDQLAALRWVRGNIERFGGDPGQVTIFGESAGGMSVGSLLGMPEAHGLFRGAVAQSGACHHVHEPEAASEVAAALLRELGIEARRAARELREVPARALLTAQQKVGLGLLRGSRGLLPFQPVVDGDSLPETPLEAVRRGAAADVCLLTGTTRDEWKLFGLMDTASASLDEDGLLHRLERTLPDADLPALIEAYRQGREGRLPTDPLDLFHAIETDRVFRIPAIRLAEAQAAHQGDVFMYRFDWASPAFGGRLGACHAIELPFLFGKLDRPGAELLLGSDPGLRELSEHTMDAWLAFARQRDPGHARLPEPWPAYDSRRRATQVLDRVPRLALAPDDAERAAWEGLA